MNSESKLEKVQLIFKVYLLHYFAFLALIFTMLTHNETSSINVMRNHNKYIIYWINYNLECSTQKNYLFILKTYTLNFPPAAKAELKALLNWKQLYDVRHTLTKQNNRPSSNNRKHLIFWKKFYVKSNESKKKFKEWRQHGRGRNRRYW